MKWKVTKKQQQLNLKRMCHRRCSEVKLNCSCADFSKHTQTHRCAVHIHSYTRKYLCMYTLYIAIHLVISIWLNFTPKHQTFLSVDSWEAFSPGFESLVVFRGDLKIVFFTKMTQISFWLQIDIPNWQPYEWAKWKKMKNWVKWQILENKCVKIPFNANAL